MSENALIEVKNLDPVKVFVERDIEWIKKTIETGVAEMINGATVETANGRQMLKSAAYQIARSKTLLDTSKKEFTAKRREELVKINAVGNELIQWCEEKQKTTRAPLTEWEAAEAARIEAERLAKELEAAHEAAITESDLWNRQREIERKEAALRAAEEEKRQKEEAERRAKEQAEREERIRQEAIEKAKREAEDWARKEKEAAERRERELIESAAKREREIKEAQEKAERDRIAAEERAKIEKEMAVRAAEEKAHQEAERKEQERLAEEARIKAQQEAERREAEKIAANKEHRRKINREIIADLSPIITEDAAKKLIAAIVNNEIRHISIKY